MERCSVLFSLLSKLKGACHSSDLEELHLGNCCKKWTNRNPSNKRDKMLLLLSYSKFQDCSS